MIYSGAKHPPEISDTPNEFLGPGLRMCALRIYVRVCASSDTDEKEYIDIVDTAN